MDTWSEEDLLTDAELLADERIKFLEHENQGLRRVIMAIVKQQGGLLVLYDIHLDAIAKSTQLCSLHHPDNRTTEFWVS